MRVWGMGCKWGKDDQYSDFISNRKAVIGWSMVDAPDLYAMLREVELGDVIYLKSYIGPKKELRIRCVGRVTSTTKLVVHGTNDVTKKDMKYALGVSWVENFNPFVLSLKEEKYTGKNNVYNNTFYREYNPGIIEDILQYI